VGYEDFLTLASVLRGLASFTDLENPVST